MRDLIIYLIGINVVTFFIYGIDKWKARRGNIGALLGMYLFRHKTQHKKFTLGIPAIILVQAVIVYFFLK